jgi:hypothetical protein
MTEYAVVWHDQHTDPAVYLFDTEPAARAWLVAGIIEYLESYGHWQGRVAMAARLHTMPVEDAYPYIMADMVDDMNDELENLNWHITAVERPQYVEA